MQANNERGTTHEGGDDEIKPSIEDNDDFDRQMREKVIKKLRGSEMEEEEKKLSRK